MKKNRQSHLVWTAVAAVCVAAGLVYALVHLGLWQGVATLG